VICTAPFFRVTILRILSRATEWQSRLPRHELILYHTCKSQACPRCGCRATLQWLRERWAALPDVI